MEKESEEETKVAEVMKAMEEGQSTVQKEEKTQVDEAMKPKEEGQHSAVQTDKEKTKVDESMKSMDERKHSVTEPEIKKEEEAEVINAVRLVEEGQHSMQEKQQRQHSDIVVAEKEEEDEEMNLGETIRRMEIGCTSWIAEMEDILNSSGSALSGIGKNPPSIYRVPDRTKRLNPDAYRPMLVSLGPFYYGEPDLMKMEDQKKEAVLSRVKQFGKPLLEYIASIQEVADELLNTYEGLDDEWRRGEGRDRFVQMMVLDGCFLLELMECHFEHYSSYNPIFSNHGRLIFFYSAVRSDMALLENQLPPLVLQKILALEKGKEQGNGGVNCMVLAFMGSWWPRELQPFLLEETAFGSLCFHTLDALHKSLCGPRLCHVPKCWGDDNTMPSAVELNNAGIHFKVSTSPILLSISFNNSVLSIPVFEAREETEKKSSIVNTGMLRHLLYGSGSGLDKYC